MGAITPVYGTRTAFPSASNLNSLATGSAAALGVVDGTALTPAPSGYRVDVNITLGPSTISSTGTLVFYLLQASDVGTWTYTDNLSPTGTGLTIKNALPVATLAANTNSQVIVQSFDLPMPYPPLKWTLVCANNSGAALPSSGNAVNWTPISFNAA